MSDWNPAAFNWCQVLASAGFEPRWWFAFLWGVAVGLCLPLGLWVGLASVGCAVLVIVGEYVVIVASRARRERKRLIAYRESVGHRRGER